MAAMGQAAGGEGQSDGGQGQGEGQQSGPDLGSMVDQIGQIAAGQEDLRQFLSTMTQQNGQEGEQQQQGDELDLSWLDQAQAGLEDPAAIAARLSEQINGAAQQQAQALIAPMQQQMVEMRRDQQARDLAAEFPELASEDMANKIAGPQGLAMQMAQQLGQPELAAEPSFWRLVYMANKAAESANTEGNGSDGPEAAHLESGSGAAPGSTDSQEDRIKRIMQSGGRGSRVLDGM